MTLTNIANPDLKDCIDNCDDCHSICLETVTYSLDQGSEQVSPDHVKLLLDCAEICQTSANFMIRDSRIHDLVCGVCAEICEQCANACDQMDGDQMQACTDACRECAESCRQMSK